MLEKIFDNTDDINISRSKAQRRARRIQKRILSGPKFVDRSPLVLGLVKGLVRFGANSRIVDISGVHTYMPDGTRDYLDKLSIGGEFNPLFFCSHRSLLETVVVAKELNGLGYKTPHIIAGDNLFKGAAIVYLLTKTGMIVSDRTGLSKRTATRNLQLKAEYVLTKGNPIIVFSYDGRSKDGLTPNMKTTLVKVASDLNTTIVPTNIDYFEIPEEADLIRHTGKPYTLTVKDFFKTWAFRDFGDIRITFGKPIIPSDISNDRNILAEYVRAQIMDLVQIYSRNVTALSMMQRTEAKYSHPIEYFISGNLEKLASQSQKFIDFTSDTTIEEIIFKAKLADKDPKALKLYGNSIRHYVEGMYHGK